MESVDLSKLSLEDEIIYWEEGLKQCFESSDLYKAVIFSFKDKLLEEGLYSVQTIPDSLSSINFVFKISPFGGAVSVSVEGIS